MTGLRMYDMQTMYRAVMYLLVVALRWFPYYTENVGHV